MFGDVFKHLSDPKFVSRAVVEHTPNTDQSCSDLAGRGCESGDFCRRVLSDESWIFEPVGGANGDEPVSPVAIAVSEAAHPRRSPRTLGVRASGSMLCQKCKQKEALVHISVRHGEAAATEPPEFTLHFCPACGEEHERESLAKLFPPSGEQPFHEQLRVIQSSSEHTVVRLVRTESQPSPEEWRLLTSRLPEKYCCVGMEFGVTLTYSQLEYLKGGGDLT